MKEYVACLVGKVTPYRKAGNGEVATQSGGVIFRFSLLGSLAVIPTQGLSSVGRGGMSLRLHGGCHGIPLGIKEE